MLLSKDVTYRPDRAQVEELRKRYPVVPVWREVVADLETPVSAFTKLASGEPRAFLLESVEHGERWGRYSFVGVDPFLVMKCREGSIEWEGQPPASLDDNGTPLQVLRSLLGGFRAPALPGLPPFHGGGVGYLGYDVIRYLEHLPQTTKNDLNAPELLIAFARTVLVFDHLRQTLSVVTNLVEGDEYDEAIERTDSLVQRLGDPLPYRPLQAPDITVEVPESTMSKSDFEAAIERAKEYIFAGDIFQVVIAQRFSMPLSADPLDAYRMLRLVNPSPYMFFLKHPEITVIGSSPEPLIKVVGDSVIQRPIAGTFPRGETPEEDLLQEHRMTTDEKERAEHVMLVDLARNDLGRVCRWGSVKVDELLAVERYSHVMHLVSQVSGVLDEKFNAIDALYASFPAGTVSGAPKIRAMEIIDELEPTRRGPYAGIVGYFDFSGNIDTCIALRTAYIMDGVFHIQAGGGIVADSNPSSEWMESVNKAKALLTAAKMAEALSEA